MKRNILWMWTTSICLSLIMPSCKDGDEGQAEAVEKGAEILITAVFAPNQLGDNGYADLVMDGLQGIKCTQQAYKKDTLDVSYISQFDRESTINAMVEWAKTPRNPFTNGEYKRRLLILTENYMLDWIDSVIPHLHPVDEVLVMKCAEEDLDIADERLKLGKRLHGMNISIAEPIRKFCKFMKDYIKFYNDTHDDKISMQHLLVFRIYPDSIVNYRDSISEVLSEQLGGPSKFSTMGLSTEVGTASYSDIFNTDMLNASWYLGMLLKSINGTDNTAFFIVDMGAANAGFDYFLLGMDNASLIPLMLDAKNNIGNKLSIIRNFNLCLIKWGSKWTSSQPESMPRMEIHGNWDNMCIDNIQ
ncbi:MAG: hypothetical protein K5683_10530 [Prevotella sp.]|nr:hypothetical protein [Prevotella sp.]